MEPSAFIPWRAIEFIVMTDSLPTRFHWLQKGRKDKRGEATVKVDALPELLQLLISPGNSCLLKPKTIRCHPAYSSWYGLISLEYCLPPSVSGEDKPKDVWRGVQMNGQSWSSWLLEYYLDFSRAGIRAASNLDHYSFLRTRHIIWQESPETLPHILN